MLNKLKIHLQKITDRQILLLLICLSLYSLSIKSSGSSFLEGSNDSLNLKAAICTRAITKILSKETNPKLTTDNLIAALENSNFEGIGGGFTGKLHLIKQTDNNCSVIAAFKTKLRSFKLFLEKDNEFPFTYKLADITEITSKDLL